jgi:hypothetical protein
MNFCPQFSHISVLGEIHDKRAACNAAKRVWVVWKSAVKLYIFCGCKQNYIYSCTVVPLNILKVKYVMVKSVYYISEYMIVEWKYFIDCVMKRFGFLMYIWTAINDCNFHFEGRIWTVVSIFISLCILTKGNSVSFLNDRWNDLSLIMWHYLS